MIRLTLLTLFVNLAVPYPGSRTETNFCSDKKPGLFSQGCSSNVTICNSFGREMWLLCPFGLIFDGSIEECVDYRLASECSAKDKQTKTGIRHLADLPSQFCANAPEGFHAVTTCSSSVIQCTPAGPSLMECPLGLVYDDSNYLCVNPSELASCQPAKAPEEPKAEAFVEASGAVPAHSVESKNSCEGLADGLFEHEACSPYFLTCSGGVSRIMSCPANLVFDKRLQICEYPGNVQECDAVPGFNSSELCPEDGFFSYGNCSDLFYACTNGRQIPMYCPAKLAFDETRQLCDYPLAVAACAEENSDFPPSELASEGSAYAPIVEESWDSTPEPVEPENTTPVPQQLATFCENKPDGFYASGCSSEMIACVAGVGTSMLCPAHLIFDERKQICEYPENVPCSATKQEDLGECEAEGTTAHGPCSNTFTNCVEGKAYSLACDDGYVFSETHGTCTEASKVAECATATTKPY